VGTLVNRTWPGDPTAARRADRTPCRYTPFVPDPLTEVPVTLPPDVASAVADAERAIADLNTRDAPLVSTEGVARILLRAESVASSRIEGLEVGSRRLARLTAARTAGADVSDATASAVLANIEAMVTAIELADRGGPVTTDDLFRIHAELVRHDLPEEYVGRPRTDQNWIGGGSFSPCGADFVPPPPRDVPRLLDDLMAFVSADHYSPLVQAALAHAQFETIHPFADGNGRTGRALVHVVLRRRGAAPKFVPPISLALATASRDYVGGLTSFRYVGRPGTPTAAAGVATWIDVFAAATLRAATDAQRFAGRLVDLERRWRERAGRVRRGSATDLLLAALPGAPIVTVTTAAALIDRSFQATNDAVAALVEAGVLTQVTLGKRYRAFEADGLVDAVTAFERSPAVPPDTDGTRPARAVPRRQPGSAERR
jgi:Fic family protein